MTTTLRAERLRCEHLTDPLGVDVARPRLRWEPVATEAVATAVPAAYQVQVASSPALLVTDTPDLWDSGRVDGAPFDVEYDGRPLAAREAAHWRVRLWPSTDGEGAEAGEWSATATWEVGLPTAADWQATWITAPEVPFARDQHRPSPLFRRTFDVAGVRRARLYVTALGLCQAFVNGEKVSVGELRPGWTDYSQRVQYQALDVTDALRDGTNVVGLVLGEGWYCGRFGIDPRRENYGPHPQVLAQLVVDHDDGSTTTVATDTSWRWAYGPILASNLLQGEIYDARQEQPGWDAPGFDDGTWQPALEAPRPAIDVVWSRGEPTARTGKIAAVRVTEPVMSTFVFDFGQNLVGWCRLQVDLPAGTEVVLRHGEALHPDGTVYTANLRAAISTDRFIARGGGPETFEPSFTLHGFRYVEVTGIQVPFAPANTEPVLPASTLTAVVVHADMPEAGAFECSDPLVERIHLNSLWSLKGNFVEVPTDCPQRNERLGWLGDARIFSRTASYLYDTTAFFTKWLDDVLLARTADGFYTDFAPWVGAGFDGGPGWSDAGVFIPWLVYERSGDRRILEDHLDAMATFVDVVHAANPSLLRENRNGMSWGDWLSLPDGDPDQGRGAGPIIDSVHSTTDKTLFATAFFARSAELVAKAAEVVGRAEDAERFAALAGEIKAAWTKAFVQDDDRLVGDTQTAYALALCFDLVPDDLRPAMGRGLAAAVERNGHLTTGITGTELLLPALTEAGRLDLAYRLLQHRGYPSWGYTIDNGATSVWERWDGWTDERGFQDIRMNSFNHYALGSVAAWIYETVGGLALDRSQPGGRRLIVHPQPGGGITWARMRHRTSTGWAAVDWRLADDGTLEVDVEVPVGATAEVVLPGRAEEVGAGRHTFRA